MRPRYRDNSCKTIGIEQHEGDDMGVVLEAEPEVEAGVDVEAANESLRYLSAEDRIRWAVGTYGQSAVLLSSMQKTASVLMHPVRCKVSGVASSAGTRPRVSSTNACATSQATRLSRCAA